MHEALETEYARRRVSVLVPLAKELEKFLIECMNGVPRIDRISARAKAVDSFMGKATKTIVGKPKYNDPLNEIQDQVGARIVTYYASDVPRIEAIVKRYFRAIESTPRVPESQWTFGYFGYHDILVIPSDVIDGAWNPSHTRGFLSCRSRHYSSTHGRRLGTILAISLATNYWRQIRRGNWPSRRHKPGAPINTSMSFGRLGMVFPASLPPQRRPQRPSGPDLWMTGKTTAGTPGCLSLRRFIAHATLAIAALLKQITFGRRIARQEATSHPRWRRFLNRPNSSPKSVIDKEAEAKAVT
jgi:hypothetical protein